MAIKTNIEDYIGVRINYILILNEISPHITKGGNKKRKVKCSCVCGKIKDIYLNDITSGKTKSCGCYSANNSRINAIKRNTKHNLYYTPEYNSWSSMKKRCLNKTHKSYDDYGGRGIDICESWLNSFDNFISDMGFKKSKDLSLDRIDNNKGYYKENCRWATRKQQGRNQRTNVFIEFNGQKKTLAEWSEIYNIEYNKLRYRILISKMKPHKWFV